MPKDRYANFTRGIESSAQAAFAVTPSDTNDLPESIRAITIGTAGTLSFLGLGGAIHTTAELPAGTYAVFTTRIRATGTTATKITGWV